MGEVSTPRRWDGSRLINLDAGKISSGVLAVARGGFGKALSPTWTDDYILVYDSATDAFIMEPKPSGGGGGQFVMGMGGYCQVSITGGGTRYFHIGGATAYQTENLSQGAMPACTVIGIKANVVSVPAGTHYVYLRRNGQTVMTLTITSTGIFSTTGSVSVADNDLLDWMITTTATGALGVILTLIGQ